MYNLYTWDMRPARLVIKWFETHSILIFTRYLVSDVIIKWFETRPFDINIITTIKYLYISSDHICSPIRVSTIIHGMAVTSRASTR